MLDNLARRPTMNDQPDPIPVIIDCDPGTDDAFALLLALASPELKVLAITVVGGNAGLAHTLRNALALRALARSTVPVFAGADHPLLGSFPPETHAHGPDGLLGIPLSPGSNPETEAAPDAIRRILRHAPEQVTLIGIGPATNLALALATEPSLLPHISQIVLMAGAWGEGNFTPSAEFNAANDPEALQIVLSTGRPVTLATLELTAQAVATPQCLIALRTAGAGACLRTLCDIQDRVPPSLRLQNRGGALHDPCAVAWLIRPDLFTTRKCPVSVDLGPGPSRGRTIIDRWGRTGTPHPSSPRKQGSRQPAPMSATLLETLDPDGFFALLAERLSRLP